MADRTILNLPGLPIPGDLSKLVMYGADITNPTAVDGNILGNELKAAFGGDNDFAVDYIKVDIYTGGSGNNIKARLVTALKNGVPIDIVRTTRFFVVYSVGYTLYTAVFEHTLGAGTFGGLATEIEAKDLELIHTEVFTDILDPLDLDVATSISDSINNGGETYDTSLINIFRRTIDGEVRVFAYTPSAGYEQNIGGSGAIVSEDDFEDITSNGDDVNPTPLDLYVNLGDYDVFNDGVTDNTSEFDLAVNRAILEKKYLYIPSGKFKIVVPELKQYDMSGCPGIIGTGEIIVETVSADTPVFYWEGGRELISSSQTYTEGDKTATINQGFEIKTGDTVFLICPTQSFSGNTNTNYIKGQRLTVDSVVLGASSDTVTFQEQFDDDYTGYLAWNSNRLKVKVEGINVSCNPPIDRKGVEFTLCDVEINSLNVIDFQRFNVNISSSKCRINGLKTSADKYGGTFTSYGLQVSGLSDVISYSCDLNGGRHGLTHGDVAFWNASYFGLTVSNLFLPSVHTIYSSNISSNDIDPSLDVHRGTKYFKAVDSVSENGAVLGGKYDVLENCTIKSGLRPVGLTLGRDGTDFSIPFGKVKIINTKIISETYPLKYQNALESVEIDNLEIVTQNPNSDLIEINDTNGNKAVPVDQNYKNINIEGVPANIYNFNIIKRNGLSIDGLHAKKVGVFITEGGNLTTEKVLLNNINTDGATRGLLVTNLDSIHFKASNLNLKNSVIDNCYFLNNEGVVFDLIDSCFNDATGSGVRIRSDSYTVNFSNVKSQDNGGRGIQLEDTNATGNNSYSFSGVLCSGNNATLGDFDIDATVNEIAVVDSYGVADTTWQTPTLPADVSGSFRYKIKNGNLLIIASIRDDTANSGAQGTPIFTLPELYIPDEGYQCDVLSFDSNNSNVYHGQILVSGNLSVNPGLVYIRTEDKGVSFYISQSLTLKTDD